MNPKNERLSPLRVRFAIALDRRFDDAGQLTLDRCGMDFYAP